MVKGHRKAGQFKSNLAPIYIQSEKKDNILRDIAEGKLSKKEIANKYHMSIGNIVKILDMNRSTIARMQDELQETSLGNIATFVKETKTTKEKSQKKETVVMLDDNITTVDEIKVEQEVYTENNKVEILQPKPDFSKIAEQIQRNAKRKRAYLSPDMVTSIVADLTQNIITQREIADMYGISQSTVSKIKKAHNIMIIESSKDHSSILENKIGNIPVEQPIQKTEEDTTKVNTKVENVDNLLAIPIVESITEKDAPSSDVILEKINGRLSAMEIINQRTPVTSYLKVGMIKDRHNMPTDIYIYDEVSEELMFDYEKLYSLAENKIKVLLRQHPILANGLYVYVTGLCCALATIIKVCDDNKLNLTLLHYHNSDRTYHYQKIITKYGNDNSCVEQLLGIQCRNLYTYNCKMSDISFNRSAYDIIEQHDINDITPKHKDVILFTNKNDAWSYYIAATEAYPESNIYFNKGEILGNRYYRKYTLSKFEANK